MWRRYVIIASVLSVLSVLVLSGCAFNDSNGVDVVKVESDEALFDAVVAVEEGETVALASLTAFSWDGVYCYYEGTLNDEINDDLGVSLKKSGGRLETYGAFAVFVSNGQPVRTASIPELSFDTHRKYSSNVLLRNGLSLIEPDEVTSPNAEVSSEAQ